MKTEITLIAKVCGLTLWPFAQRAVNDGGADASGTGVRVIGNGAANPSANNGSENDQQRTLGSGLNNPQTNSPNVQNLNDNLNQNIRWVRLGQMAMGLFIDARMVWSDETKIYGVARAGLRFAF